MSAALLIRGRRHPARRRSAATPPLAGVAAGRAARERFAYPGIPEPETRRRGAWLTGSFAALLHAGALGALMLVASLSPAIREELAIPVQLLRDAEPPPPPEPAPAPRALAERRLPSFAPQLAAQAPQVVNPAVIAQASPVVSAKSLELESVGAVQAPTSLERSAVSVERVRQIESLATARASAIDVSSALAPALRGPALLDAPRGPSVGPREVASASAAPTLGSATFEIGGAGSSVREGAVTGRDVIGTPEGAPVANVATAVGDAYLRGAGGSGAGLAPQSPEAIRSCLERPEVDAYLGVIRQRTISLWKLPIATPDTQVVLRFQLDVAGSPSRIQVLRADDNALGASAIDAMRAAAPFPPMPDPARCIADRPITGTFRTFADGNAG